MLVLGWRGLGRVVVFVSTTYHVADFGGAAGEDEGDLLAGAAEFVGGRTGASEAELPALDGGGHSGGGAGEESHGG
jgi:hypothetical protein